MTITTPNFDYLKDYLKYKKFEKNLMKIFRSELQENINQ